MSKKRFKLGYLDYVVDMPKPGYTVTVEFSFQCSRSLRLFLEIAPSHVLATSVLVSIVNGASKLSR